MSLAQEEGADDLTRQMEEYKKKNVGLMEKIQKMKESGNLNLTDVLKLMQNEKESKKGPESSQGEAPSIGEISQTMLQRYRHLSLEQTRKIVETNLRRTAPGGKLLELSPKFSLFMASLYKSPDAISSFIKIIDNRSRLYHFAIWNLVTIILGFILKRYFREERPWIKFFSIRMAILYSFRLAIFINFFGTECAPALKIFHQVYFS